jgi:tight adherence protein B
MTASAAVLSALAFAIGLVRSPSPIRVRLDALSGRLRRDRPRRPVLPGTRGSLPPAAVGGGVLLGGSAWLGFGVAMPVLPAVAGAIVGGTAAVAVTQAAADRERRRIDAAVAESVGALAADLRAGRQPAEALAALGDDPATRHRSVQAVWTVSEHSGAPTAAVLDRVEQDLRARQGQRREIAAALAGARSAGILLAVLPVLGIGLGGAMGAHPLAVLFADPRGQLALVVGAVLEAVGVLWILRIVAVAEDTR